MKKIGPHIITECNNLRDIWFLGNAPTSYMTPAIGGHAELVITRMINSQGFNHQWCSLPVNIAYNEPPDYANPLISDDEKWTYSISGTEAVLIECLVGDEVIIIPEAINSYPVVQIASTSFDNFFLHSTIKKVIIPNSVKILDPGLFNKLHWMKEVSIGNNITTIPQGAFENCTSLEKIHFGNNVEEIGKRAFSACLMLEQIILPDSVKIIDDEAFAYDESLFMVSIGKNIQRLGEKVFMGCEYLEEIRFRNTALPIAGRDLFPTIHHGVFVSYNSQVKNVPPFYHNVPTKPYYNIIYSTEIPGLQIDANCYFTGDEVVIKDSPPDKLKREFLGWVTGPKSAHNHYDPDDIIIIGTSSITLYPQFGDIIGDEEAITVLQVSSYSGRWNTDWGEFNMIERGGKVTGIEIDSPTSFLEGTISKGVCTGSFGEIVNNKKKILGAFSFTRKEGSFTGYRCDKKGMPLYMCDQWNGTYIQGY
ncbi:MAG: leucine-rich repeat domain-containing protein [Spirochaetia bacterium]|nr:leucine-rich repeat domain-containing protein [Spirochaetia bacterium]